MDGWGWGSVDEGATSTSTRITPRRHMDMSAVRALSPLSEAGGGWLGVGQISTRTKRTGAWAGRGRCPRPVCWYWYLLLSSSSQRVR